MTPSPSTSPGIGTLPPPLEPPLASPCGPRTTGIDEPSATVDEFRWSHKTDSKHADFSDEVRLFRTSGGWLAWNYDALRFSPDLRSWTAVPLVEDAAEDEFQLDIVEATPEAQVAIGGIDHFDPVSSEWLSTEAVIAASQDGRTWLPVIDPDLNGAAVRAAGSNGCDLVLAGTTADGQPTIWTSSDGMSWTTSTDPDAARIAAGTAAFATGPGMVLAIAGDWIGETARLRRGEVWRSTDGMEWERLGWLPGSSKLMVDLTAYGNGRWLILGTGRKWAEYTWTSADGVTWERIRRRHVVGVTDVAGYEKGFIATGYYGDFPGTTCGSGEPYTGRTWVTDDGIAWTEVSRTPDVSMVALAPLDGRLYGIGLTARYRGRTWWGRLPGTTSAYGPATLGPLPPGTGGCGD